MKEFDKQIVHLLEDKRKISTGSAWARGGATSQVVRVEDILLALVDVFRKAPEHPVLAVCLRTWGGHGQARPVAWTGARPERCAAPGRPKHVFGSSPGAAKISGYPEGFSVGSSGF